MCFYYDCKHNNNGECILLPNEWIENCPHQDTLVDGGYEP